MSEELTFDLVTTGASNDLEHATSIARQMVTRYGMSKRLGPRTFGKKEELVFLGRDIAEQRDYSDKTAEEIDGEVHDLIDAAYNTATELLKTHKSKLAQVATYLIANETVEGKELKELFDSEPPEPGEPSEAGGTAPTLIANETVEGKELKELNDSEPPESEEPSKAAEPEPTP